MLASLSCESCTGCSTDALSPNRVTHVSSTDGDVASLTKPTLTAVYPWRVAHVSKLCAYVRAPSTAGGLDGANVRTVSTRPPISASPGVCAVTSINVTRDRRLLAAAESSAACRA